KFENPLTSKLVSDFRPLDFMIPDCYAQSALAIFKPFAIRTLFDEKWLLAHVLAGLKFENPLTSKLVSDFRPLDPSIIKKTMLYL
ncbi:MAG: hypothetical protein Q4D90_02845, partial [bacterium]|nr:hypothetical protein [bacterium]